MSWGSVDRRRVDWTYDALGRRVRQVRYVWTNGTWQVVEDLKLVSDPVWFGRHIAELNGTNGALVRSYVWGLDLSESLDGAGGVGGLLWVRLSGGPAAGVHFVTYDGNGNVWNLVSASTGTETARYEYGPFGEPLRLTGAAAGLNPFRFSTKRTEDGTGLVLYEYRAYSPSIGRWLSRDPIEEKTGVGSYHWIANVGPGAVDIDGRFSATRCSVCGQWYQGYHQFPGPPPGGGPGYHDIPDWFRNPPDEGKPCCCKPPAKLKRFERVDDPPSRTRISMRIIVELEGCYKDLAIGWWTCWRPDGSGGWMPGFENKTSAYLKVYGITIPGVGDRSTGPHLTLAIIRYLSCENGRWVKYKMSRGRTYIWSNGNWTW